MVHTHNEGGGVVLGWCGENNFFGTTFDVGHGCLFGKESSGGFTDESGSYSSPFDVGWVFFSEDLDGLALDFKGVVSGFFDFEGESQMGGIVFKLVNEVVQWEEWVVYRCYFHGVRFVFEGCS